MYQIVQLLIICTKAILNNPGMRTVPVRVIDVQAMSEVIQLYERNRKPGRCISLLTQDPFTLESFRQLALDYLTLDKELVVAQVASKSFNSDEVCFSYYHANYFNKALFRKRLKGGFMTIVRLHLLNPLTNTSIIGNINYYKIYVRQSQRAGPREYNKDSPSGSIAMFLKKIVDSSSQIVHKLTSKEAITTNIDTGSKELRGEPHLKLSGMQTTSDKPSETGFVNKKGVDPVKRQRSQSFPGLTSIPMHEKARLKSNRSIEHVPVQSFVRDPVHVMLPLESEPDNNNNVDPNEALLTAKNASATNSLKSHSSNRLLKKDTNSIDTPDTHIFYGVFIGTDKDFLMNETFRMSIQCNCVRDSEGELYLVNQAEGSHGISLNK
jgi:hypothetical protein